MSRCLVGYVEKASREEPSLSKIRRWSSSEWKKTFGVNIYELYGDMFLFEFPNKFMVEQTRQGQWKWKNLGSDLEWWSAVLGCEPTSIEVEETWINIIGILLHLWSHQVFAEIGKLCGGWVATEEEIELKSHMKWARIFAANDGRNIPKEVSISRDGFKHYFPIWVESKVRYEVLLEKGSCFSGEDELMLNPDHDMYQRVIASKLCFPIQKSLNTRDPHTQTHVGKEKLSDAVVPTKARETRMSPLMKNNVLGLLRSRSEHLKEKNSGSESNKPGYF